MLPLSPSSKPPSSPPKPSSSNNNNPSKPPSSSSSPPIINENPPSSSPKPSSSSSSSNNSSKNPIKPFSIVSVFETGSTSSSSPPIISENPSSPSSSRKLNPTSKQPSITTISSSSLSSSPGTTNNHQNAAEVYVLDNIIIPDHDVNVDVNVLLDHIDLELVPDILPPDPDDHGPLPHFNLFSIERQKLKDKKKVEKRRELAAAKAFERKTLKEIEDYEDEEYKKENPHLFDGASDDEDDDDRPVPATRCNKCTRRFTKIEGRRGHQTVHKGFDFECREEVCGSIFSTEKREALHHEKHHKN